MKFLPLVLLLSCVLARADDSQPLIQDGDRVVFLGDSNTYAGKYIAHIHANFLAAEQSSSSAPKRVEFLNLGLSSETASGLSEPDHPFPRPCVLDRIDRALKLAKPDVAFVCYGINDAIYYPFDEERFAAFKSGIEAIIKKTKASGARIVLITPPPFDALPLKPANKLRPLGADKFAWFAPYENYDEVMAKYAEWERTLKQVDLLIDLHQLTHEKLSAERKLKPEFTFAKDGVHYNEAGHRFAANAILGQLDLVRPAELNPQALGLIVQRQNLLRDAWLTHVGHKRPGVKKGLPLDEANEKAAELWKKLSESLAEPASP